MFIEPRFILLIAVLVGFALVMAWAIGHDQGAEWQERAERKRGNKKVRARDLGPIVERVEKLENAAAPTTTEENN